MDFTREDLNRLSVLTRLALSEEEKSRLGNQLGSILDYVNRLSQVDTQGVPEAETGERAFTGRADVPITHDPKVRELILKNFPDSLADALRVPAVFENPKG